MLLDLFCWAGGAGTGYARAGFDVVGVDIDPQPNYPFEFVQGDALQFLRDHGSEFDVVHASPPCQAYSTITPATTRDSHPRLIGEVRDLVRGLGKPFVIKNVEGARRDLSNPVKLCGSSFGLGVRRHRYFEVNWPCFAFECAHREQGRAFGVYGQHPDSKEFRRPNGGNRGVKATSVEHARELMGIDWMSWRELAEAIPPAFTLFLGEQLLETL